MLARAAWFRYPRRASHNVVSRLTSRHGFRQLECEAMRVWRKHTPGIPAHERPPPHGYPPMDKRQHAHAALKDRQIGRDDGHTKPLTRE